MIERYGFGHIVSKDQNASTIKVERLKGEEYKNDSRDKMKARRRSRSRSYSKDRKREKKRSRSKSQENNRKGKGSDEEESDDGFGPIVPDGFIEEH